MVRIPEAQGKWNALCFLRIFRKGNAMIARLALLFILLLLIVPLFTRRGRRRVREYAALARPTLLLSLLFFPVFFAACLFFSPVRLPLKLFLDAAAAALITRALLPALRRFLQLPRRAPWLCCRFPFSSRFRPCIFPSSACSHGCFPPWMSGISNDAPQNGKKALAFFFLRG